MCDRCFVCAEQAIRGLPDYLSQTMSEYYVSIDDCVPLPGSQIGLTTTAETTSENYCKIEKIKQIDRAMNSISTRVEAWLENAKQAPTVQAIQSLFSQEELTDAGHFVPRCKNTFYEVCRSFVEL